MKNKKQTKNSSMSIKEKKALMDTLLVYEEQKKKLSDAQEKLWRRGELLDTKHNKVLEKLTKGMLNNKEKLKIPIFYKGKSFQISSNWAGDSDFAVEIKEIKKI